MQSWKDRAGRGDPLQRRSLKTVVQPGWGKRDKIKREVRQRVHVTSSNRRRKLAGITSGDLIHMLLFEVIDVCTGVRIVCVCPCSQPLHSLSWSAEPELTLCCVLSMHCIGL